MSSSEFGLVNVENGPVRGLKTKNIFASEYYSFRGVPYMKPPLGKLRFREAERPENWAETFDATQEGPSYCMTDFMTGIQDGQEDGGRINIYTRSLQPKELFPVMIWVSHVHGEFTDYNAKMRLCRSMVVATVEAQAERICTDLIT